MALQGKFAEELVKRYPDKPTQTLGRLLLAEHPKLYPTLSVARQRIREAKITLGIPNLGVTTYKIPKTSPEDWSPVTIDTKCKIASLSDIHIPYHDIEAISQVIKFLKKYKPSIIILNGDIADFYTVSHYDKNPEKRDAVEEMKILTEFMLYIQQEFPKARLIFKEGNHEERWDKYIWKASPLMYKLPQIRLRGALELMHKERTNKKYKWEYVGEQRPIMAGKLPILHGHELPKGISSPVNMARGAFMRTMHSVLVGHGHRSSHHVESNMFHKEVACWSQGCLCHLYPAYARINKWNHGFATIEVSKDSNFQVKNYRVGPDGLRSS